MVDRILVFIPMYNCEKQIPRVLAQFDNVVEDSIAEVVVVDNISQDNSVEKAKEALAKLQSVKATLIQNDENYSLGGSIKSAFNYAIENDYGYVITLHGDDQGNIHDMLPVITSGEYRNFDLIIGARFHKDSKLVGYSTFRTVGNKVFNLLCSIVTRQKIDDLIAGLNMFNVDFLRSRFYLKFPNNLTFDAHLLLYSIRNKKKIKFIPLTWREEDQISNARVFRQGMIILKLFARYFFDSKNLFPEEDNELSRKPYTHKIIYQHDAGNIENEEQQIF